MVLFHLDCFNLSCYNVWKILQTFGYNLLLPMGGMGKLCCVDYGFECAFVSESIDDSLMIEEFAKHTSEEHGIEYSKETLMQFMLRKHNSNKFEDLYMHSV